MARRCSLVWPPLEERAWSTRLASGDAYPSLAQPSRSRRLHRRHHPHNPSLRPPRVVAREQIKGSRLIRIDCADLDAVLRPIPSVRSCGGGLDGGVFSRISNCEPAGEGLGERVGEVRVLPWSSAWTHGTELRQCLRSRKRASR